VISISVSEKHHQLHIYFIQKMDNSIQKIQSNFSTYVSCLHALENLATAQEIELPNLSGVVRNLYFSKMGEQKEKKSSIVSYHSKAQALITTRQTCLRLNGVLCVCV